MSYVVTIFGWLIAVVIGMAGALMLTVADRSTTLASLYMARGVGILLIALFLLAVLMLLLFADLHRAILANGRGSQQRADDVTSVSVPVPQKPTDNS